MDRPFRTVVDVKPFPFGIGYKSPVLFLGSCFTENIGNKMQERKFPVLVNPYGVLYNPISVGMVLKRIISGKFFEENELGLHNSLWFSHLHDTEFSSESKSACLDSINNSQIIATEFWTKSQFLIITFGTARVYYHKEKGVPVVNCHKVPAREFENKLLSVNEIVDYWSETLKGIVAEKPNIKVILTVSPIRHWKDGAEGNQHSKSTLILAVRQLMGLFPENIFYFPAFEIMMDELRDYRFYADDMLHPSNLAVDFIWDKFKHAAIFSGDLSISAEIEKVMLSVNHKPFNTTTKEFRLFVEKTLQKIEEIDGLNIGVDFLSEKALLKSRLVG